jgi:hypothetical protein
MTKHTPGPWHFDREGDFIYSGTPDDIKHIICDIRGAGSNAPMDANAELIASAPTLTAELERLKVENEKLKEALQDIVLQEKGMDNNWCGMWFTCTDCARNYAKGGNWTVNDQGESDGKCHICRAKEALAEAKGGVMNDSVNRSQLLDYTKCNNLGEVLELVMEMRKSLNIAVGALKAIINHELYEGVNQGADTVTLAQRALKEIGK